MRYRLFVLFSALGSVLWISFFTVGGYFLGNIPVIKDNITVMILAIVFISILPALFQFIRRRKQQAG